MADIRNVAVIGGGLIGASMVSDAFFPFRDGVDVGIAEDITAVIQPGGSANDYQSIEACNEAAATMVFTGRTGAGPSGACSREQPPASTVQAASPKARRGWR